jgi:hypothetical protein
MGHRKAEISFPVTPKPSVAGVDLTSVSDLRSHSRIYGTGRGFKGKPTVAEAIPRISIFP